MFEVVKLKDIEKRIHFIFLKSAKNINIIFSRLFSIFSCVELFVAIVICWVEYKVFPVNIGQPKAKEFLSTYIYISSGLIAIFIAILAFLKSLDALIKNDIKNLIIRCGFFLFFMLMWSSIFYSVVIFADESKYVDIYSLMIPQFCFTFVIISFLFLGLTTLSTIFRAKE